MAIGPHERALKKDLQRVPAADRAGAMARLGLTLAQVLDAAIGDDRLVVMPPRDLASISQQFQTLLATLAKLQEPAAVLDPVDELARKRRERRVGTG